MMRKTLSLLFVALAAMSAGADGIQVIHLGQGDALSTLLDRTQAADSLVISGPMDADDCDALGAYCREVGPRGINLADAQFENDELPVTALGWFEGTLWPSTEELKTRDQIEYVTLPAGLQTVGKRSLYGMLGLKEAVVPQGVTSIKDEAFCASGLPWWCPILMAQTTWSGCSRRYSTCPTPRWSLTATPPTGRISRR